MSSKIAHVSARDFNVLCSIYDDETNRNPKTFNFASEDLEKNVENILNQLIKIPDLHSVIFTLFDFNDFAFGYKLRLKCKKFCDEKNIRNVFIYNEILHASAGLLAAENLHISPEETFCLILVYDTYVSVYSIFHYGIYCILQNLDTFDSNDKEAFTELGIRFMSEKIIMSYFGNAKTLKQAKAAYEIVKGFFKNANNILDINTNIKLFLRQSCLINAQTYLTQKPHTFAIMPSVFDRIGVIFKSKLESSTNILRDSVMFIDGALPSSSSNTKKLVDDLIVYKFIPPNNYQILEKIDTSKIRNLDAHLFLEINSSCFYKFDVTLEKYITHAYSMPPKIFPKLLKEPKKYPLIFFEKNVFEIGLTKGNKYCILEGHQNIPSCLVIDENAKSCYGKNAIELQNELTLIYDLFKIMSYSVTDTLPNNPNWKFVLTKDVNNQIFIIFLTKNGPKIISLVLCMAGIIKNALKIIESETGIVPDGLIEIGFPDYDEHTKKIIREAGKKLKLEIQLYDNMGYRDMELVKFEDL